MYGYTEIGLFKNAADLANNPQVAAGNHIGDWMIKDQNGDGKIDANDVTKLGHGLPDFTYGLTNTFQYKSFDLSILIQGVQGVNTINGNLRQLYSGNGNLNTTTKYYQNYFDPAQPNRDVIEPPDFTAEISNGTYAHRNHAVSANGCMAPRTFCLVTFRRPPHLRTAKLKLAMLVTDLLFPLPKYYAPQSPVQRR